MWLLVSLLVASLTAIGACADGYFFHLTDLHLDINYKSGADPDKRCVEGVGTSGHYGQIACNMPIHTIKESLQLLRLEYPNPEFILYTGDSSPHYVLTTFYQSYTEQDVHDNVRLALSLIREAFPQVPLYPVVGNHDAYPSDEIGTDAAGMALLGRMVEPFAPYLPDSAMKTLRRGGYYSLDLPDGQNRLIVTMTLWCNTLNFYALFSEGKNDCGTFNWLRDELRMTRAMGKTAILVAHRPMGFNGFTPYLPQMMPYCETQYTNIITEFADVLKHGSFLGHTHDNSYRTVLDKYTGLPIHVQRVTGSFNPYHGQNPGLAVYLWDAPLPGRSSPSRNLKDFQSYYLDLAGANKAGKLVLSKIGLFTETFGIPDVSPSSMYSLHLRMKAEGYNGATYQKFFGWAQMNGGMRPNDTQAYASVVCTLGNLELKQYDNCMKQLGYLS